MPIKSGQRHEPKRTLFWNSNRKIEKNVYYFEKTNSIAKNYYILSINSLKIPIF